jgi:hypothetical protein
LHIHGTQARTRSTTHLQERCDFVFVGLKLAVQLRLVLLLLAVEMHDDLGFRERHQASRSPLTLVSCATFFSSRSSSWAMAFQNPQWHSTQTLLNYASTRFTSQNLSLGLAESKASTP